MYYAMEKECQECKDETKFATGCWDGMDEEGRWISGMLTDCNNLNCPIKKARMEQIAKEEQRRCCIKIQNKENGIDIDLIREQARKAGITVYEMSRILEMRASEWCDRIYGRTAMEPGTAIRAMDAILKAKDGRNPDTVSRKAVYDMLNDLGGADAKEEYFQGWDAAIDGAISGLEKIKGGDL